MHLFRSVLLVLYSTPLHQNQHPTTLCSLWQRHSLSFLRFLSHSFSFCAMPRRFLLFAMIAVAATTTADPMLRVGYFATMTNLEFQQDLNAALGRNVELVTFYGERKTDIPPASFYDESVHSLDAMLVTADTMMVDRVTLGNDLATFAQKGRCVILSMFALHRQSMEGAWPSCLVGGPGRMNTKQLPLGAVHNATHPIMQGVTSFVGSLKAVGWQANAERNCRVVAEYEDGTPLVVVTDDNGQAAARHVVLNFFPVSDAVVGSNFYHANTTGGLLLRNALEWCVAGNNNANVEENEL